MSYMSGNMSRTFAVLKAGMSSLSDYQGISAPIYMRNGRCCRNMLTRNAPVLFARVRLDDFAVSMAFLGACEYAKVRLTVKSASPMPLRTCCRAPMTVFWKRFSLESSFWSSYDATMMLWRAANKVYQRTLMSKKRLEK